VIIFITGIPDKPRRGFTANYINLLKKSEFKLYLLQHQLRLKDAVLA